MKNLRSLGVWALGVGLFPCALSAQWVNYPTPGVPRTANGKPNLEAACPRTADGKPDLSGLWVMQATREANANFPGCEATADEFVNIAAALKGGLPYQPWAADLVKARRAELRVNDPMSHCLPIGPVRLNTFTTPSKMIQTPGLLLILNEWNASYRQVFTDARPLPVDPNPSWNGYSSGKWEGDTLVVETNGLRDGLWLDATGNPLTEVARLTERFRRPNFGHMEIEVTVNDPKAYTKPWTVTLHHTIKLDTELLDFVCNENEQDAGHLSAK
jgi:hypothetical protein